MWAKHDFFFFLIKWIEIVLTQFFLGLTGIVPPCRIKDALKRCCKWNIIIKYWGAAQNAFNCMLLSCHIRRHEDIIINSMTQTREKWNPRFRLEMTFEWYEGAMVFRVFIFFYLEPTVKINPWVRMISVTVMVIVEKKPFWKLLVMSYVQSFSQKLRGILTTAFERHLQ